MQLISYQKQISLFLIVAMSATIISADVTAPPKAIKIECNRDSIIGTTLFVTALVSFIRLVTKKTQPQRVYPKDDSLSQLLWYFFDEILVGQIEKGDRASKVVFNSDNPNELEIKYSKIEPRGITGIIYSKMKPVIIPALTFALLFNENFKAKAINGAKNTREFIRDPLAPFKEIFNAFIYGHCGSSESKVAH